LGHVQANLPAGWSAIIQVEKVISNRRIDAVVELTGPDQAKAVLVVEAKSSVLTRDLTSAVEQLRSHLVRFSEPAAPMLVAPYLPPSARAWLEERGISYADVTGNLRLVLERPAIFLRDRGADRDPWRGPGRPRGGLQGKSAARVVRALVDFFPPLSVPELVQRSGASTGATYRVVEFLEREALIDRMPRGPITAVAWRRMLQRWSTDYGFQHSNTVSRHIQPRGLQVVVDRLAASPDLRYAVTGSLAAQRLAPYADPRLAMVYVDDVDQVVQRLDLRALDSGANVLLAATDYDVVFDRLVVIDGIKFVAPSQTAVDLLTGPGRSPAEAEALLDWMEAHERDWRR